ncbi:MAG: toxin-antitoxin system TumE family protein [Caulobacteraceae bacterium]
MTTRPGVVILSNMKAQLLLRERHVTAQDAFAELVVWRVPASVPGSARQHKYALAYVVGGECVLRYDNESGKGGHRHFGAVEGPYRFTTLDALLSDFWRDVEHWKAI